MKRCIYGVLWSILFISCQSQYTHHDAILRAEAVMVASPDSAYNILSSISHPEKLPKADYAAWCLHYTHAQYKLQKEIPSDSIIQVAVKYYKDSELKKQSGTAYYLLGCVYRKLGENKTSMEAFKNAEYTVLGTDDNKLKGLIYFNMGYICKQDELYNQSLNYFNKSLRYFRLLNDRKYLAYSYREISDMCYQLDYPFDKVIYYSNLALRFSKEAADSVNYYSILARQGELLYNKDPKRSKQYILESFRHSPSQQSYYAAYLSYLYSVLQKQDSAKYYLHIALNDSLNVKTNILKYQAAAMVERNLGNYKKGYDNMEKAYVYRDSVFQGTIRSQIYRTDKQYDLTKVNEKSAALEIANRNKVIWIGGLVILVLAGLIIFLLAYNRFQKIHARHIAEHERKDYELELKKSENNQKKELLLLKLMNRIDNTLRFNRLNVGVLNEVKKAEFMDEIRKQSILSEAEWEYYIQEVNQIFDQKMERLSGVHAQLTKSDKIVISLICLGLDISDSCSLLNMTKNAMYHRRKIIKERIGIQREVDLEDWLKQ